MRSQGSLRGGYLGVAEVNSRHVKAREGSQEDRTLAPYPTADFQEAPARVEGQSVVHSCGEKLRLPPEALLLLEAVAVKVGGVHRRIVARAWGAGVGVGVGVGTGTGTGTGTGGQVTCESVGADLRALLRAYDATSLDSSAGSPMPP